MSDTSNKSLDASTYRLRPVDRKTLSTNQLGAASEWAATAHLIEAGYHVSLASDSPRYDLIVEFPSGELKKVQVKTGKIYGGRLKFNAISVVPRTATSVPKTRPYTVEEEADFFAVYSPELNATFLIPNTGSTPGSIRLGAAQSSCVPSTLAVV